MWPVSAAQIGKSNRRPHRRLKLPLDVMAVLGEMGNCPVVGREARGGEAAGAGGLNRFPPQIEKMEIDLYNYPAGHAGPKRFVHVRGHSRSVASPYTYKGNDGFNHVRPEYGGTYDGVSGRSPLADSLCTTFMPDIHGFVSPIDGAFISSRSQRDVHLRQHEVIEVGNEKFDTPADRAPMQRAGLDIKRAIEEIGSR